MNFAPFSSNWERAVKRDGKYGVEGEKAKREAAGSPSLRRVSPAALAAILRKAP
jgi:hypothetical protein